MATVVEVTGIGTRHGTSEVDIVQTIVIALPRRVLRYAQSRRSENSGTSRDGKRGSYHGGDVCALSEDGGAWLRLCPCDSKWPSLPVFFNLSFLLTPNRLLPLSAPVLTPFSPVRGKRTILSAVVNYIFFYRSLSPEQEVWSQREGKMKEGTSDDPHDERSITRRAAYFLWSARAPYGSKL